MPLASVLLTILVTQFAYSLVATPTTAESRHPQSAIETECVGNDLWDNGILDDPPGSHPAAPGLGPAVWTGRELIVWDGSRGGKYNPITDEWTPIDQGGPSILFSFAAAVWSGTEMIVFGGGPDGRYNPAADTWTPVSRTNYPPGGRLGFSAVWTGAELVVWGGDTGAGGFELSPTNQGAAYDPSVDLWRRTSVVDAAEARAFHWSAWTGTEMIVWGGLGGIGALGEISNGGRYDPVTDRWTPVSEVGVPAGRQRPTMLWTGDRLILWGGLTSDFEPLTGGGRYDPATDTWFPLTDVGAPTLLDLESAVWTGTEMIVWCCGSGGRYDPLTDSWTPITTVDAPSTGRTFPGVPAVWTGSMMIVWDGSTGGRYIPSPDSDVDGDGFAVCEGDCDDSDASIHPGAADLPGNLVDENCDGVLACDPTANGLTRGQLVSCIARECQSLDDARLRDECMQMLRGH